MKMTFPGFFMLGTALVFSLTSDAQVRTNKKESTYNFTVVKEVAGTEVKDQFHSGTCWAYSTQSFLESELMRMGKGNIDLSEMYIVRCMYIEKAVKYVRMMGKINFGQGGEQHDVMACIRKYGLMPQSAYAGLEADGKPRHGEMEKVLKAMLDAVISMSEKSTSDHWLKAYTAVLDAYLGTVPAQFTHEGKTYDAMSFAKFTGINPDDYIELTSFTHHPFYAPCILEIPDNWAWAPYYNVPLNEFVQVTDNALMNNYAVAWASDVSESFFSFKNGLAIVPEKEWDKLAKSERDSLFIKPGKERVITQQNRQHSFDNLSTQDDHGMHITGLVKDQNGTPYYIVKNSWGTEGNDCGGYFYASQAYFQYKTIGIMVNKKALPKELAKKLNITQ